LKIQAIKMNKGILTLLGTSCGFVAGILLSSQINDVGKTFALAGAMTIPSVFVAHLVIDSKATESIKKSHKKASESGLALDKAKAEAVRVEAQNQSLIKALESVKQQLGTCEAARLKVQAMYDAIAPVANQRENELIISQARISELTEEVEILKFEVEQWEAQFHSQLALHVEQKAKELRRGELLKIFNEHDALVQQASEIIHRFQNWSEAVGMKHEAKRQLIVDLSERYSENIGEVIEGFNQEKDGYLREIEERNEVICDTAREFRIAMVTASRSPVFYQLPYFDSVEIDVNTYQEILAKVSVIRERRPETRSDASVSSDSQDAATVMLLERPDPSGHSLYAGLGTRPDTSVKPNCPHCGSDLIRSKGDKWLCQNPEHTSVAPDKPKTWKK
jgi:hypothetical protein